MPMTAKATLQTLQKLIDRLSESDAHECTMICMTISYLFKELESWALTSEDAKTNHPSAGSISIYITEMTGPLNSIAGIYDYGHSKEQCISWLNSGIKKLAGVNCLNVKL